MSCWEECANKIVGVFNEVLLGLWSDEKTNKIISKKEELVVHSFIHILSQKYPIYQLSVPSTVLCRKYSHYFHED
jgi:hypothetical protein